MWLLNGEPEQGVQANDRGLAYGDGVFRTLRLLQGQPQWWERQYAQLAADAARLRLNCPPAELWRADIARLAAAHGDGVIKCILTRGSAGRGYALPAPGQEARIVLWSAAPQWPDSHAREGIRLRVCQLRLARQPALAGIKHLNRLENVLARAESDDAQWAEGVLLDDEGMVVEGIMSNIFWRRQGHWFTPLLQQAGVAGVTRGWLLQHLQQQGQQVQQVRQPLEQLLAADEVLVCNSLIGLWPVRQCADRQWQVFPAILKLQEALKGEQSCA